MLFKDIVGNEFAKKQLLYAVDNNRLAHAVLFLGEEGDAKLQLALALATYLNCEHKHDGDACGECKSCKQMATLSHPEMYFVYPTTSSLGNSSEDLLPKWRDFVVGNDGLGSLSDWYEAIGVTSGQGTINAADCNNIISRLSYTSYESKYKIVIMWMVEKLFYSAAPKLLKVLEEPPEDTVFMLLTENKSAILDTIISRTQSIKIPKFTNKDVVDIITKKFHAPEDEAAKIAEICEGNASLARRIYMSPESNNAIFDKFIDWMQVCYRISHGNKCEGIVRFAEDMAKMNRERAIFFLKSTLSLLRQALYVNITGNFIVPMSDQQQQRLKKFAIFVTHNNIGIFYDKINDAIRGISRNGAMAIIFANLTLSMSVALDKK